MVNFGRSIDMPATRQEYMHAYYEANKERRKQLRKKQPRTEAAVRAEAKYREKQKTLAELENFPFGISPFNF